MAQQRVQVAPRQGDTIGIHHVRQGETLQVITQQYLGTPILWRENWRLNPQLKDPDRLFPGQKIRVITRRDLPKGSAQLASLIPRVEDRIKGAGWQEAAKGDHLQEGDGLRTFQDASAELHFEDGSKFTVVEESLVFLRKAGKDMVGRQRKTIEIIEGQAEVSATLAVNRPSGIEIIVGDAVSKPKPGPSGLLLTRTRAGAAKNAQVMVYAGTSEVGSGGASVNVPQGMGTVVEKGAPPRPPEKLLRAPALNQPASRFKAAYANPTFAWQSVAGAQDYTLEVCNDAECNQSIYRQTELKDTRFPIKKLPAKNLFWRVTARSPSGLDGFPSQTRQLEILSGKADREAPVVVAVPLAPAAAAGSGILLGQTGGIILSAFDDAAGVAQTLYRWDEGPWQDYLEDRQLSLPKGRLKGVLAFKAKDHLGQWSRTWEIVVNRDNTPPPPPQPKRSP